MEFRKDINGLRAIAVIAVIFFHFNESWLPGGFIGVDVFFVISGFLMTKIILTKVNKSNFSTQAFYKARARRIVPPLTIVCFATLIFGWFYLNPSDYNLLAKHIISSITFASNFTYWLESGYFDISSKSKWLLHTWSLSTEWQFYILYPLIIITSYKYLSGNALRWLIFCLFIVSLVFSSLSSSLFPDASYFLLPTRAWEMLCGALIYFFPSSIANRHKVSLSWIGIFIITSSYFYFSKNYVWPRYYALIPVFGAYLVLISQHSNNWLLSNLLMQKIGNSSYSIYLWHWFLIALIYFYEPTPSIEQQVIGIVLSIILGYVSYLLIERKYHKNLSISLYFSLLSITLVIYILPNLVTPLRNTTAQYNYSVDWVERYKGKKYVPGGTYWYDCNAAKQLSKTGKLSVKEHCIEDKGNGGIILWGDSHAGAISESLSSSLNKNIPYNQLASTACEASWNQELYSARNKKGTNRDIACNYQKDLMKDLVLNVHPNTVIIIQARGHDKRHLIETGLMLKKMGVRQVIIVGPVPQWLPTLSTALSKPHTIYKGMLYTNSLDDKTLVTNRKIKTLMAAHPELDFIDLISSLCEEIKGKIFCKYKASEESLMTFDYGHPTQEGAKILVDKYIYPAIDKKALK